MFLATLSFRAGGSKLWDERQRNHSSEHNLEKEQCCRIHRI